MPKATGHGQNTEKKPWGTSELLFKNRGEGSLTAKILTVNPRSRLSLQLHRARTEYWFVMEGVAEVNVGDGTLTLRPGETVRIPPRTPHRLGAREGTKVFEVSIGSFDESDIIRLEDDYGRA